MRPALACKSHLLLFSITPKLDTIAIAPNWGVPQHARSKTGFQTIFMRKEPCVGVFRA
jgi:hypothetical protein